MAVAGKANLRPLSLRVRPAARLTRLYVGLVAYAVSMALMIEARLGNQPWDVFHQGVARLTGLSIGTVTVVVGVVVLLLWIPLRQRPGIGTLSNVVVIGVGVDAALSPRCRRRRRCGCGSRFLVAGVLLCAVASGLYIGARLGPGPRDGLMTGLAARGHSIRVVRTGIEVSVVAVGFLLGGTLGVGTVVYALAIGPLVHITAAALHGSDLGRAHSHARHHRCDGCRRTRQRRRARRRTRARHRRRFLIAVHRFAGNTPRPCTGDISDTPRRAFPAIFSHHHRAAVGRAGGRDPTDGRTR